jgi:hypothetical protein
MCFAGIGKDIGIGAGTEVVDVADTAVEDAAACAFFSERVEYMAAVKPAPVAAEMAAMRAIVDFDILEGARGSIYCDLGKEVVDDQDQNHNRSGERQFDDGA